MSTLCTSVTVKHYRRSSNGVWFDVQSEGPPLRITAILAACVYDSCAVVVYGSEEGSGVGKERERGAWGQLAAGTLQDKSKGTTRMVLSSLVSVRAGARAPRACALAIQTEGAPTVVLPLLLVALLVLVVVVLLLVVVVVLLVVMLLLVVVLLLPLLVVVLLLPLLAT